MKVFWTALGVATLLFTGACASTSGNDNTGNNEVKESPCEWGDNRPGCEQEKIQCVDPRNCY